MAKKKNKYGQYFTTESVAEFMITLISQGKESSILEPSCGKGLFLKMLSKKGYNNLNAYEIDNTLDNPFSFVHYRSFLSVPLDEKYDVIIGNPPYIRWKNLEKELKVELANNQLWNQYFNSLCDYLFIFILKSIEHLNKNGELIFICPEYWMNTTHSQSLRNYMISNGYISDIYQFKEAPLFEGVRSSFVIFRFVKTKTSRQLALHKYIIKGKPTLEQLTSGECFETIEIPQFEIGERWILASNEKRSLIGVFENYCMKPNRFTLFYENEYFRIGDFCDIGNGMVSGFDKAFQLPANIELTKYEQKNIIKVYKAKDLTQYSNVSENRYIFIKEEFTEETFKERCPHFYKQLEPYAEKLNERYSYGKDLPIWEFAFPRNEKLFRREEKRIFIPCKERISTKNYFRFALAEQDIFPLQDVTGIFRRKDTKESIEYILAYLNNERVFEWLKFNGIVKGEIVEFSEAPIASIPFRPIDWNNVREVEIHNRITEATNSFITTHDEQYKIEIENNFNMLFNEQ